MFQSKKNIIFITKNIIKACEVFLDSKIKVKNIIELEWSDQNLAQVLGKIKEAKGSNFRILLAEEFIYILTLAIPANLEKEKEYVIKKAQEILPENLSETVWDFKEVLFTKNNSNEEKGSKIVQVVVTVKSFLTALELALKKVKLHIEAIEPLSFALARLTSYHKEPHILVYFEKKPLVIVVSQGMVISTQIIEGELNTEKVKKIIDYIKEHFNLTLNKLIFGNKNDNIDIDQIKIDGLQTEFENLDPMIGLAAKKDIKGKDREVLNLEISDIELNKLPVEKSIPQEKVEAEKKPNEQKNNLNENKVSINKPNKTNTNNKYVIFGIMSIIFAGLLAVFFYFRYAPAQTINQTKNIISPSPITKKDEKTLDKNVKLNYKIKILNGSGIEGAASKLSDLLKKEEYEIIELGNAESYDFDNTTIRAKEKVEKEFIKNLGKVFESKFNTTDGAKLDESEQADIIITIGRK